MSKAAETGRMMHDGSGELHPNDEVEIFTSDGGHAGVVTQVSPGSDAHHHHITALVDYGGEFPAKLDADVDDGNGQFQVCPP